MNLKIKGLDGKIYPWNPRENVSTTQKQSSYYQTAKKLLRLLYSNTEPILEEISLPGTRPILYADFVLTRRKMIVEVHGEQHYESLKNFEPSLFNPTRRKLAIANQNDRKKKQWCQINNFYYIELPYYEDLNEWRYRIENASLDTCGGEED